MSLKTRAIAILAENLDINLDTLPIPLPNLLRKYQQILNTDYPLTISFQKNEKELFDLLISDPEYQRILKRDDKLAEAVREGYPDLVKYLLLTQTFNISQIEEALYESLNRNFDEITNLIYEKIKGMGNDIQIIQESGRLHQNVIMFLGDKIQKRSQNILQKFQRKSLPNSYLI